MTGAANGNGRPHWRDPKIISGLGLFMVAGLMSLSREHADSTTVGLLLAAGIALFGVKVDQIRNGGGKE